jgi:biopolymer transport protein TolQ
MSLPLATIHAFTTAFANSDFFGKLIFLGLLSLSFVCWVILLYKIWILKQVKAQSLKFLSSIEKQKGTLLNFSFDTPSSKSYKEVPQPFIKIFSVLKSKTVELLEKNHYFISHEPQPGRQLSVYLSRDDIQLVEAHVYAVITNQKEFLEKHLFLLPTITTLAPFLGLLGTVWGILVMFSGLQLSGNFSSNTLVLGGLSTALATTVLGLLIAIPSLIAYSCLRQAIKSYTSEMQDFGHLLLSTIELQYRKVDLP